MNALQLLQIVQALSGLIELAADAGVDIKRLADLKANAKAEGRDLSDEELLLLANSAQTSIDNARNA